MSSLVQLTPELAEKLPVGARLAHYFGSLWEVVSITDGCLQTCCLDRASHQPNEITINVDDPESFKHVWVYSDQLGS